MKPIPNAEGYYAGKNGNIYSTKWCTRYPNHKPRALVPILMGYEGKQRYYVNITMNGKWSPYLVSYLVLLTFVSDRPSENYEAAHGPNGAYDNSLKNLSWRTRSQNNYEDKLRDGTLVRGSDHVLSKLNETIIIDIFQSFRGGASKYSLAKKYKVCHETIRKILDRRMWAHVAID